MIFIRSPDFCENLLLKSEFLENFLYNFKENNINDLYILLILIEKFNFSIGLNLIDFGRLKSYLSYCFNIPYLYGNKSNLTLSEKIELKENNKNEKLLFLFRKVLWCYINNHDTYNNFNHKGIFLKIISNLCEKLQVIEITDLTIQIGYLIPLILKDVKELSEVGTYQELKNSKVFLLRLFEIISNLIYFNANISNEIMSEFAFYLEEIEWRCEELEKNKIDLPLFNDYYANIQKLNDTVLLILKKLSISTKFTPRHIVQSTILKYYFNDLVSLPVSKTDIEFYDINNLLLMLDHFNLSDN